MRGLWEIPSLEQEVPIPAQAIELDRGGAWAALVAPASARGIAPHKSNLAKVSWVVH